MKSSISGIIQCVLALSIVSLPAIAQATAGSKQQSARQFVQEFYDWYTPVSIRESPVTASDIALKVRRSSFASELFRNLQADSQAQASCNDIVGIDFDPFLFSQDPAQHYVVEEIRRNGQAYSAAVYSVQSGERSKKPDVIADLIDLDGHWTFTNFHYPDIGTDLLAILSAPKPKCTVPRSPGKPNH